MTNSQAVFLEIILILIVIAIFLYLYFIPTLVAINRKRVSQLSIFVINLFLGSTIIAWVLALAWAVSEEKVR